MCGTINYQNETNNWNNSEDIIDHMNIFIPENSEIKEVYQIKEELLKELNDTAIIDKVYNIKEHEDKIKKFIESYDDLLDSFSKQQVITMKLEKELKDSYSILDTETNKIICFSKFVTELDTKYQSIECEPITRSILEVSRKIKEKNDNSEIKPKYEKELYILNYYLQNFVKKVNKINLGTTCSLCLQRNVDTYMNPCGHTGCSECISKLKKSMGEYNCNCFICRTKVLSFNALYFI